MVRLGEAGLVRRAATVVAAMAIGVVGGCSDDGGDATATGGEGAEPMGVQGVWYDPADDRHLIFAVDSCSEGAAASVEETPDQIVLSISGRRTEIPCTPERLEVYLEEPLGRRQVVDAGDRELADVVEAAWLLPPDTSSWLPATCDSASASEAVRRGVDGGLRSDMLDCNDTWLVVATSVNACPATGEAPDRAVSATVTSTTSGASTGSGRSCRSTTATPPGGRTPRSPTTSAAP
jgi:hypothetical protein